jgi:hypothetical protein
MASCIRCGKETSATYCVSCRGWAESLKSLIATAEPDAELLKLAATMNNSAIARQLGVSRVAVGKRLGKARARQLKRAQLDMAYGLDGQVTREAVS